MTTDQKKVVAKQEIQVVESAKRSGAPYAHHRNQAIKRTDERDELHVELTLHCDDSAVTMSKVLHRVYLTWKHLSRWIEVIIHVT